MIRDPSCLVVQVVEDLRVPIRMMPLGASMRIAMSVPSICAMPSKVFEEACACTRSMSTYGLSIYILYHEYIICIYDMYIS